MRWLIGLASFAFLFVAASPARAVPPPDFLFSIGSSIGPAFSFIILVLSAIAGAFRQALQPLLIRVRHRGWLLIPLAGIIVVASAYGAVQYDRMRQERAYQDWLAKSAVHADQTTATASVEDIDLLSPSDEPIAATAGIAEDAGAAFIRSYYQNIGSGRLAEAYAVSKQTVPLETFESWYADTRSVRVDSVQKISDDTYSLALTLTDHSETTRYAVLMTLGRKEDGSLRIASSDVRVLSQPGSAALETRTLEGQNAPAVAEAGSVPLVSNEGFARAVEAGDAYVLDAREDEEYAYGRFPDSAHIRFADLVAGEWIQVPIDRPVYVLCWSGMRGKEVAGFLRTKGIDARALENGANGWVGSGGVWNGLIAFTEAHPDERYVKVFSQDEVRAKVASGTVLVDTRPSAAYETWHIPGSINVPVIYTPSAALNAVLDGVPSHAPVITVCDDFISCFDARITGLKLEARGHEFFGRYASPWEFRSIE